MDEHVYNTHHVKLYIYTLHYSTQVHTSGICISQSVPDVSNSVFTSNRICVCTHNTIYYCVTACSIHMLMDTCMNVCT